MTGPEPRPRLDLRTPLLGGVAWAAALLALHVPPSRALLVAALVVLASLALVALLGARILHGPTVLAWALVALVVVAGTSLRVARVDRSGLADLVADRATVHVTMRISSDPALHRGRFHEFVILRASLSEASGRGRRVRTDAPVLVIGDPSWRNVRLGSRVSARGRLDRAEDRELAGVLVGRGPPRVLADPPGLLVGVDGLRHSISRASAAAGDGAAGDGAAGALVPALVDGDDAALAEDLKADFRVAGLTHLLAVSGTNLTLIVGFLIVLARWVGVRARGLLVVGVLGVVGFVLLARTEPSVVRAAAMGSVALLGMASNGRGMGVRALGVAVCCLLLVDPWLADSPGFALSVCATAGILLLAPGWRDAILRWLPDRAPRWVAEAVAVPLAAQLACTPIVAGLSGQVSLVAVAANLAAAPVVGPATVLGLLGGVFGLVSGALGALVALPATWCAAWIVAVARFSAAMPTAAVGWSASPGHLVVLTALCLVLAAALGRVLSRRGPAIGLCAVAVVGVLVPLPHPGWPPRDWVFVVCDVGQGDGLVLRTGPGSGIVVDTGPEPDYIDRCLDRLDITRVPLVVLTHFHSDHVDGLAGVLAGRRVGGIAVSPLGDPPAGVRLVHAVAAAAGVPVRTMEYGESGAVGPVRWQVLAPSREHFAGSDSPPNDASLVMLVEVRGVRLLLMGDEERPSQALLGRVAPHLRADVLKVAHHGSSKQDERLVAALGARLAVISCGRENSYGHPAHSTLRMLRQAGMVVARTDQQGDVAVVVDGHGRVRVATRIPARRPPPGPGGTP